MAVLRQRTIALAIAASGASCHAILGFEEGTPLGEGGASPSSTSSSSQSAIAASSSDSQSSSTSSGAAPTGTGGSNQGGGGAGASGGAGGSGGIEGPPPAECETGATRSLRFGDAQDQARCFGAFGPDERIALGGQFVGEIDFGGGALEAEPPGDAFVAVFDDLGDPDYARAFSGGVPTLGRSVQGLLVTTSGVSWIAGNFAGSIDIDEPWTANGGPDGFVARLDENGAVAWATPIAGPGVQTANAVVLAPSQVAIVGGGLNGTLSIAGDVLDSASEERGYVLRVASGGLAQNAVMISLPGPTVVRDLVVNGSVNVLVGLGDKDDPGGESGGVVLLDGGDAETWATPLAGSVLAMAVDDEGAVYVAGSFDGQLAAGDESADSFDGTVDGFVARLDAESGEVQWIEPLGGAGIDGVTGIVVGCDGRLIVVMASDGDLTLAGKTLPMRGGIDLVAARLERDTGEVVSATRHGGTGHQIPFSLDVRNGAPLVTGVFGGDLEIGAESLESEGGLDGFFIQAPLAPAGEGRR